MKKLLSLLTLLICTMGAVAQNWDQDWVNPHSNQAAGKTYVFANFVVVNGANPVYQGNYTLAAFIGDECRWMNHDNNEDNFVNTDPDIEDEGYLAIEIPGDYDDESDADKAIKFYAKDSQGNIYELVASTALTYGSEARYGEASNPITLTLTYPASINFTSFEVNKGETVNLLEKLTIEPTDAQLPLNYEWSLVDESNLYATINGDILTATAVTNEASVQLMATEYITGGTFSVVNHATAINIVTDEITVYINDEYKLDLFMKNNYQIYAYSLTPTDATDAVLWEFDSEYIAETAEGFKPVKGGETYIRPYIDKGNGNKLYPANNKKIKVTINVPVTDISFNWPENVTFKCNVGDDIYQRLANRVVITPSDATNKEFDFEDPDDDAWDYLDYNSTAKTMVAKKAGTTHLMAVAEGDIESQSIKIEIFPKPATTLAKIADPLIISSNSTLSEASQAIANNLTWGPKGTTPNGTITASGDFTGSGTFSANGASFNIAGEFLPTGIAAVSATLNYNTYDNYDGTDASITKGTAPVSFVVRIVQALAGFDITVTPNSSNPSMGTIVLKPLPTGAECDMTQFTTAITAPQYDDWTVINLSPVANQPLQFTYSSVLPGEYTFTVSDGKDNGVTSYKTFEVPAQVQLASGWQWKSNPYGTVANTQAAKEAFFGTTIFSEARTYDDLLYKDTQWGFYGSLNTEPIEQAQMYKVKMNGSQSSYLTEGRPAEDNTFNLQPGWNWVGSPYFYNRSLDNVFIYDLPEGTVVVSKSDGSAELNASNQWQGSLQYIKKGEGYLIYNPTSEPISSSMACEIYGIMSQGNENASGARSIRSSVWSYDHSRFANNMTMVVEMPELRHMEDYTIGAFVDGECRGEGSFENGYGFVTVHCNSGEQVSFQLHNELTGEYYDIDQTVKSQTRIGSLKAPYKMTSMQNTVTGIGTVNNSVGTSQHYDLNGRQLNSKRKGVNIQRMPNGTVRKVVVR